MTKFLDRIRFRLLRYRSPFFFISFPKSGRTWIKSFLANYYSCYTDSPPSYDLSPLLKVDNNARNPRIMFSHAKHRAENDSEVRRFIDKLENKSIVLAVRDPQRVVFGYYYRLIKRMADKETSTLDFSSFVRHESLGIPRIIKFMNEWYDRRDTFCGFLLLRYEDCVIDPDTQFTRLLDFLSVPCDATIIRKALARSVDTTRKVEEGGLRPDEDQINGLSSNPHCFETMVRDTDSIIRYAGDDSEFNNSFTQADLRYIDTALKELNPVFGYWPRDSR